MRFPPPLFPPNISPPPPPLTTKLNTPCPPTPAPARPPRKRTSQTSQSIIYYQSNFQSDTLLQWNSAKQNAKSFYKIALNSLNPTREKNLIKSNRLLTNTRLFFLFFLFFRTIYFDILRQAVIRFICKTNKKTIKFLIMKNYYWFRQLWQPLFFLSFCFTILY